ncbi:hypothetical protein BDP81DRAFT_440560, partial [Colletotrichum phormii]
MFLSSFPVGCMLTLGVLCSVKTFAPTASPTALEDQRKTWAQLVASSQTDHQYVLFPQFYRSPSFTSGPETRMTRPDGKTGVRAVSSLTSFMAPTYFPSVLGGRECSLNPSNLLCLPRRVSVAYM